ncbi:ABC transporter permease [Microbacterium sp. 1P10UB]|uniref:ABC transporter permease n=1 Tax=unclassified Microbacterium TaxID=2609290 RepID=UPI00399EF143
MNVTESSPRQAEATTSPPAPRRRRVDLGFQRFSGLYVWAGIIVIFGAWIPSVFLTSQTLVSLVSDEAVTAILAVGLMFTLAAGGFDLSIGQNLGLSAILTATLSTVGGWNPWAAAIAAIVCSTAIGALNGLLVAKVGINSLIATLGMTSILLALSQVISDQQFRGPVPADLRALTAWQPLGIPAIAIYAVAFGFVAWYLLEHTPFGRRIYATGAGPEAAFLAGVRTSRYLLVSFMLSGLAAGIGGVLLTAKIGSIGPTIGPSYLLPCFAACFLGTTQIKPGKFNVWGTLIAIGLLATGVKGLQLVGGQQWITDAFNGVALIGAVSIAVVAARRASAGRARKGGRRQ